MRCDNCGRFTRHLNDVWNGVALHISREVCDDCYRPSARRDKETP